MNKFGALIVLALVSNVFAQVKVQTPGTQVSVGNGVSINATAGDISSVATEGNSVGVTVGGIDGAVSVQGVTVINGKVWIDGVEIPGNVTRYKSKSGTVYRIVRKDGQVAVSSE